MEFPQLQSCCDFDPAAELEAVLLRVPARWVVYLFADADDRPIQLLCVKNLRASLRRRLGPPPENEPSRRVDYRQLVRRVYWRRVDSHFEADLLYLELARQLFPDSYEQIVAFRPAWFLHIDIDAPFPRYVKTETPATQSGQLFGPLEHKADAQKLIEQLEDWFDLCRYHNILAQAPHGRACAYKEMGRCPAPCDGTVSMEQYRRLIQLSAAALADPADFVRGHERRMQQAAGALKFEAAAKIKQYVDSLSQLGAGPFRHVRPLDDLRFITLQRGPGPRSAKVFLITPTAVRAIACLLDTPQPGAGVVQLALTEDRTRQPMDRIAIETLGVVARHLFAEKPSGAFSPGAFIPLDQFNEESAAKAYRDIVKQKLSDETEDEGIVRELQSVEP